LQNYDVETITDNDSEDIVEDSHTNDLDNEGTENFEPLHNLRENRTRDYSHRFGTNQFLSLKCRNELPKQVIEYIMTQMTAAASIKKQGAKAVEALLVEFCQLDDKDVFKPITASKPTVKQKL
jgi:hypothetical protein